jgi:hypothetical protein
MAGLVWPATPIPFWMAAQNTVFDSQVAHEVAQRAGVIVLRSSLDGAPYPYGLADVVTRFKQSGTMPVLAYAFANRSSVGGRIESDLMRGFDSGPALATVKEEGNGQVTLLDMSRPDVRRRIVDQYVAARKRLPVDGFAFDLSTRTPLERPAVLARQCKAETGYCSRYADGMDTVFADLRTALGRDAYLVYNGLFNFTSGQIDDQVKLLAHTNAAAIEFFGMNPRSDSHSFGRDILPFVQAIGALPADKAVLVFGRGSQQYTSYLQDYEWQRYLYASFLLAARPQDMFKYHSTFQVPTRKGRAGGLDIYADWAVDLGKAQGPADYRDGLYRRRFEKGLVVVAPDDGRGAALTLERPMYTPEGAARQGRIHLVPGTALLLLEQPGAARPERKTIDATKMASWNWSQARLQTRNGQPALRLRPPPEELAAEHDLLLDWERSTTPYTQLQIHAALTRGSSIAVVAEVDDRRGRSEYAIVELSPHVDGAGQSRMGQPLYFKTRERDSEKDQWPITDIAADTGDGVLRLDGRSLFTGDLRFRRWSHLRFKGSLAVSEVTLSRPSAPAELPGER